MADTPPWEDYQGGTATATPPWEDFKAASAPTTTAPWEDFAPKEPEIVPTGSLDEPYASTEALSQKYNPEKIKSALTTPVTDYLPPGALAPIDIGGQMKAAAAKARARGAPDTSFETAAGVAGGAQDLAKGFLTPQGISMLGIGGLEPVAQRAASAAFAAQMASQTPEIARQLGTEMGKPEEQQDKTKIAQLITQYTGTTGFAALAGAHGLSPKGVVEPAEPEPTPKPATQTITGSNEETASEMPVQPKAGVAAPLKPPATAEISTQAAPEAQKPPPEPIKPAEAPKTAPTAEQEPDYANMSKPHEQGVIAGLKLAAQDVPDLKEQQAEASQNKMTAIQSQLEAEKAGKPDVAQNWGKVQQHWQGKETYLGGVIEGANKEGPNYDLYVGKDKPSPFANTELAPETNPRLLHGTDLEQKNAGMLRVAAKLPDGSLIIGKPGDLHFNLNAPENAELGFVTPDNTFLDRDKASQFNAAANKLPPPVKGQTKITVGNKELVGMGGATPSEFSLPTIEDQISGGKLAPPEEAIPPVSTPESKPLLDSLKNIGDNLKGIIGSIAGKTFPRTTIESRKLGELGSRWISSRIAAKPKASVFVADVLSDSGISPRDFGAALAEDNLRSIKDAYAKSDTPEKAQSVQTLIGKKGSPFKTEEQYQAFLKRPEVQEAMKRHQDLWSAAVEPQYKTAMGIEPDVELPSRGKQTGARINLRAVQEGDTARDAVRTVGSGNLLGTLRRKSPFGVQATGAADAYHVNYYDLMENTFGKQDEIANKRAFEDELVKTGNAVIADPGQSVKIKDKPAISFPLKRTGFQNKALYVNRDLATEYRIASNVDFNPPKNIVSQVIRGLNSASFVGLVEPTTHVTNLASALFQVPSATGSLLKDSLLSATGRADIPVVLTKAILKGFQDNRAQIAALSEIGAMRETSEPTKIPVFRQLSQGIAKADQITRLVLDDTYQRLAEQGLVDRSETARREFVNQVGQYNMRAQGYLTQWARKYGLSPFVTAGKNFNALAMRGATLDPGVKASSGMASAMMRGNMASKWIGSLVLVGTLNYLLTKDKGGGVGGRPGTPIGTIDLGTNDKNGKPQGINLFALTGQGRALRVTGARGVIESKRLGLPNSVAGDTAFRDIINSQLSPWAGPAPRFLTEATTGYPTAIGAGRQFPVVPPGTSQHLSDFKNALVASTPVGATIQKATQPGSKGVLDALASQVPRFAPQAGRSPEMVDKYPQIVEKAQANEFMEYVIHTARGVPMDQRRDFVNQQVQRLPQELRAHAQQEATRRGVYKYQ